MGDLRRVLATAYDAVDASLKRKLLRASPHNVLRLELPAVRRVPGKDRYQVAADLLARWRESGVMRLDDDPSYFVFAHDFRLDGRDLTQLGVVCLCSLHDWSEGEILPHERTMKAPLEDRFHHLAALRATFSLGILVSSDSRSILLNHLVEVSRTPPLAVARRGPAETHRMWQLAPDRVPAEVLATLRAGPLYMGDGHHRFEAALKYRQGLAPAPGAPEHMHMAYIVSSADPGLLVLGAHRVIRSRVEAEPVLRNAGWVRTERVTTARFRPPGALTGLEPEALDGAPAIWLIGPRHAERLVLPEESLRRWRVPGMSSIWNRQVSGLLHRQLIASLSEGDGDRVIYTRDTALAIDMVANGSASAALLLPPTPLEQVIAVADAGEILPAKSTHFFPKPPAGMVMRLLDV